MLLGSTEKMGVGVNVQLRAYALHHLDCPWRPADLAQREGRILRQGNFNPEVEIIRYVSERSFDAFLWQTVERKARFIGQVMRGKLDVREIEDIGDTAMSYSEVKALATGDPRILEKAHVDTELIRLERLERAHGRNQRVLSSIISQAENTLPTLDVERHRVEAALARAVDTSGDKFTITIAGTRCTSRADAAAALRDVLSAIPASGERVATRPVRVATLAGFDITATAHRYLQPHLVLELVDVPRSGITIDLAELRVGRPLGIITKLENRAGGLDRTLARISTEHAALTAEAGRARADYGQPFTHAAALAAARARSAELTAELAAPPNTPPAAAGTEPTVRAAAGANDDATPSPHLPTPPGPAAGLVTDHGQHSPDTIVVAGAPPPVPVEPPVSAVHDTRHGGPFDGGPLVTQHTTNAAPAAHPAAQPSRPLSRAAPSGGWADADRVPPPPPPDTSTYLSAQRYPIGTALTVHAIGESGPGRRLGYGIVVGHPSPAHVTVESPWGTVDRRSG